MFLVRSVFWLGLAFLLIGPRVDLGEAAHALSSAATDAGSQIVTRQLLDPGCADLGCAAQKAVAVAGSHIPSAGLPMQDSPAESTVPFPRRRPVPAG